MFDPSILYVLDDVEVCNAESHEIERFRTDAAKDRLGSRKHPKTREKAIRTTGGSPNAWPW
jgi:hypothetical protein